MPKTDGARVLADLKRLTEFGRYKTGVHRPTYSQEDVASRQWLAEKFAEAGLEPVIDGIGNVFGRNPHAERRLLVGSHSETQPHGGWLDGALGVIYALELARAFREDNALACQAIATPDPVLRQIEAVLRPLAFSGPCNVDYKRTADGRLQIFEINPRLGGTLMLPSQSKQLRAALACIVEHAR